MKITTEVTSPQQDIILPNDPELVPSAPPPLPPPTTSLHFDTRRWAPGSFSPAITDAGASPWAGAALPRTETPVEAFHTKTRRNALETGKKKDSFRWGLSVITPRHHFPVMRGRR